MSSEQELATTYPWITNKLFEDVLKKKESCAQISVISILLKKALGKGENYGSDILKAEVKYLIGSDNQRYFKFPWYLKNILEPNIFQIRQLHHQSWIRQCGNARYVGRLRHFQARNRSVPAGATRARVPQNIRWWSRQTGTRVFIQIPSKKPIKIKLNWIQLKL